VEDITAVVQMFRERKYKVFLCGIETKAESGSGRYHCCSADVQRKDRVFG